MTIANHVIAGSIIGLTIKEPILAIIVAFTSQFAMDMLPHFGYPGRKGYSEVLKHRLSYIVEFITFFLNWIDLLIKQITIFYVKIQDMFKVEKFDLLISVYIFCIAVSELMGAKTFPLANIFGYQLNASVAIFVLPLIFTINDVITEVYGKERTRSVIRSGLFIIFLILAFSILTTSLSPSLRFQKTENAYDMIFGLSARIAAASLTAFALAEFMDVFIFAKIREKLGKKALWFRNNASNFVSQFIDTSVFMFLAFYAFDKGLGNNVSFLVSLILPYWLLKCFMSALETPFVYLGVKWLQKEK